MVLKQSKIDAFKLEQMEREAAELARDELLAKMQKRVEQNAMYNKNLSGPMKIGGKFVNTVGKQQEDEDSDENDWDS